MDNKVLLKNVDLLSKLSEQEVSMMPAVEAPLPSVEQVKQIVTLVKNIIFPDYFNKRQSDETIRSYYIGVHMEELARLLTKQIAHGLQFCEDCEAIKTKQQIYEEAERLTLEFIDALPEIKRLLYTDVQAMFDNDPAAPNYGEVIFCYPVVNTMTHYRIAHKLHQLQVPVIPRIITEQAHSKTGIDIHPGAQIGEYFAIDHGTGVVIGETCIIGNHVTLYQGVTLGAKSFTTCHVTPSSRTTSPSTPMPPSLVASPLATTPSSVATSGSPTTCRPTRASSSQRPSKHHSMVDSAYNTKQIS